MGQRKALPSFANNADIRLLGIFRVVAECGGFAAAENVLNVKRSTISVHIAQLEARLDMRLCERGRKGFWLTEQGQLVLEAAQQLFSATERFHDQIRAAQTCLVGELSIGYVDQCTSQPSFKLVDAIRRFHATTPKVYLSLRVTSTDEIERQVIDGRLDVGIIASYRRLSTLDYGDLFTEEQGLYCGRGHVLYEKRDEDIDTEIVSACDYVARAFADESELAEFGIAPNATACAFDAEGIAHMILTGHYIGVLPDHYANHWARCGMMRKLEKVYSSRREFKVVTRCSDRSNRIIGQFLSELFQAHRDRLPSTVVRPDLEDAVDAPVV